MYLLESAETRSKQASLKVLRESLKVLQRGKRRLKEKRKKKHMYPPGVTAAVWGRTWELPQLTAHLL